jgi:hypothetical protein
LSRVDLFQTGPASQCMFAVLVGIYPFAAAPILIEVSVVVLDKDTGTDVAVHHGGQRSAGVRSSIQGVTSKGVRRLV